jgi:Carboxypeptidase regulatory-like domain
LSTERLRVFVLVAIVTSGCGATPTSPTGTPTNPDRTVTIRGRVQDLVSRPIVDARVLIVDGPRAGLSTTTNEDGRFAFVSFTTPAELTTLRVEKDGYTPSNPRWHAPDDLTVQLRSATPLDIQGQYAIAFAAAAECTQLPSEVRSRNFTAAVSPVPDRLNFTTALTGANFQPGYDTFSAIVASDAARFLVYSWDAFNWWGEDQPIIERLPAGGYVSWMGTATTPVVNSTSSITATFDGSVSYCSAPSEPTMTNYPPTCSAIVECKSDHHQVVLKRR